MSPVTELSSRIDTLERGYEYLLAYAAQGRQSDEGTEARQRLTEMFAALTGFGELIEAAINTMGEGPVAQAAGFLDAVRQDATRARGAIGLVLSRPAISSMLVDNLNASIHVRALLTDCFLIDQAFK